MVLKGIQINITGYTMTKPCIATLQKFIFLNNLDKDGLILFDATVLFYKDKLLHSVNSQVQVINLPESMVIYIFEFLKEEYDMTEMYSTAYYHLKTDTPDHLQITDNNTDYPFVVAITPL